MSLRRELASDTDASANKLAHVLRIGLQARTQATQLTPLPFLRGAPVAGKGGMKRPASPSEPPSEQPPMYRDFYTDKNGTTHLLDHKDDNPFPKDAPGPLRGGSDAPGVEGRSGPYGAAYDSPNAGALKTLAIQKVISIYKPLQEAVQFIQEEDYGKAARAISNGQTKLAEAQDHLTMLKPAGQSPLPLPIPTRPDRQKNVASYDAEVKAEHHAAARQAFLGGTLKRTDATQR
jgi:hypothetical protein